MSRSQPSRRADVSLARTRVWAVAMAFALPSTLSAAPATQTSRRWPAPFVPVADVPVDPFANGIVILDARDGGAFSRGHIAGAQRVDWKDFRDGILTTGRLSDDVRKLGRKLERLGVDDGRRVLVCGAGRAGWGEEGRVAWMLRYLGHPAVGILDGGCDAWARAGRPTTTSTPRAKAGSFTIRIDSALRATKADVVDAVENRTAQLLDARSRAEFEGATPYFEARGGRIPGAKHLEFKNLITDESRVLGRDDVRALLESVGIDASRPVIVYCTGGVRSALATEALRAAGVDARNYDGSFWEWAKDRDLSVER